MSIAENKLVINKNIMIFKPLETVTKKIKYRPTNYSKIVFTKKRYEQPKIEEYQIDFTWTYNYHIYIAQFLTKLNIIEGIII